MPGVPALLNESNPDATTSGLRPRFSCAISSSAFAFLKYSIALPGFPSDLASRPAITRTRGLSGMAISSRSMIRRAAAVLSISRQASAMSKRTSALAGSDSARMVAISLFAAVRSPAAWFVLASARRALRYFGARASIRSYTPRARSNARLAE